MFHNSADGIGSQFCLALFVFVECIILNAMNTVAGHAWSWSGSTQIEAPTAAVFQPVVVVLKASTWWQWVPIELASWCNAQGLKSHIVAMELT